MLPTGALTTATARATVATYSHMHGKPENNVKESMREVTTTAWSSDYHTMHGRRESEQRSQTVGGFQNTGPDSPSQTFLTGIPRPTERRNRDGLSDVTSTVTSAQSSVGKTPLL